MNNVRIKLLMMFCALFATYSVLYAQTGKISGYIFDSQSEESLPGANIYLEGTSLGASTDINGKYIIAQVPTGVYQMVVTYIGYKNKTIDVTVGEGQTVEEVVTLDFQSLEGELVEVTAQAEGQLKAINEQLSARTIKNVVSAERIHELPDESAATALSRLSGVTIQEGDKIAIRGMEAKLNSILLNGVQIPSTDMNDRSTNLGFISSNLLSGIEVIKALTPDMDANAIGGVVNLRIREAPSDFHFDIYTQGNYNTQDRTSDNYKLWASVSNRFFNDKLGVFVQANADRSNGGQDQAFSTFTRDGEAGYGRTPYTLTGFNLTDQLIETNNSGGSLILDYILPKGKIMLQNTYSGNTTDKAQFRNNFGLSSIPSADYIMPRDKYGKDLWINSLQTDYDFGFMKSELSLSHSYTQKYTDLRYGDGIVGQIPAFSNTSNSRHPFGLDGNGNAINFHYEDQKSMTLDDALDLSVDQSDALVSELGGWLVGRDEAFNQHVYNASLDFTVPVTFSHTVSSEFKFGGKLTRSVRENEVDAYFSGSDDPDSYYGVHDFFVDDEHPGRTVDEDHPTIFEYVWNPNYTRGNYFLDGDYDFNLAFDRDLFDRYMQASWAQWNPKQHYANANIDDFNGTELFTAGYLMGEFNVGPKLTLLGGLRYEHYNMDYKAKFVVITHSVYGDAIVPDTLNTVDRNDDNFFPNVQLRYKFTDWADIRLAYTTSISRPDYKAILPNVAYEDGGYAQAGNTKLKPRLSTNYDAFLSLYNNKIGLFSIGGFYKKIKDTFYQTKVFYKNIDAFNITFPREEVWDALGYKSPEAALRINSYVNNPHPAYVRGLEFEWQTQFWYLPKPFNALVLNINYTRAWSDMDYQQIRNYTITMPPDSTHRRPWPLPVSIDTVRNARLLYQGDHNLNIALGIDYKGFSGRISLNMQGDVITSIGTRPEEDKFTGTFYKWDFTLQQKLPIEGLTVALNGLNVFHNPVKNYQKFKRTIDGKVSENLASIAYSPRIFQLSLRYGF